MYLAIIEMRRSAVRYAVVAASVGLVLFLILAQQALQTSLVASISGGIANQSAEVLVFDVDAQRSPVGSFIRPDLETAVRDLEGVAEVGVIRQSFATIQGEGGTEEVVILGYDVDMPGAPRSVEGESPSSVGQVLVSEPTSQPSHRIGDVVRFERGDAPLDVTGTATGAAINQLTTLWMTSETYIALFGQLYPDAGEPPANVLAVRPGPRTTSADLVAAVNGIDPDLEALTREDAAAGLPQVEEIEQGFSMIFLLFALVLPAIVGVFFTIMTLQKARPLTLLRALGAPPGSLARSLMLQVVIVVSAGVAAGIALFLPLTTVGIGGLPIVFDPGTAAVWGGVVFALGVLSAAFSARRVLRIEPIEATTGGGLGA